MSWWFCCLIGMIDLLETFWFLPKNWSHVLASPFGRGGAPKAWRRGTQESHILQSAHHSEGSTLSCPPSVWEGYWQIVKSSAHINKHKFLIQWRLRSNLSSISNSKFRIPNLNFPFISLLNFACKNISSKHLFLLYHKIVDLSRAKRIFVLIFWKIFFGADNDGKKMYNTTVELTMRQRYFAAVIILYGLHCVHVTGVRIRKPG